MTHDSEGLRAQQAAEARATSGPATGKEAAQAPGPGPDRPPAPDEFFREVVQRPDVRQILQKLAKQ